MEAMGSIIARPERAARPVIADVSNRHMHLCAEDVATLFGPGYQLAKLKDLIQTGEFACQETVTIVGKKGEISKVRILGPVRKVTQVEISMTDNFLLGVNAPLRTSGDIKGSAPIRIVGPRGAVDLKEGCIVAKRHIHMTPEDARFFGLKDGESVRIKCGGDRGLIFENVVARVSDKMTLECHLDTDEANAAGIKNGDLVIIL